MTAQTIVEGDAVSWLVRTFMAQRMQWEIAKLSGAQKSRIIEKTRIDT